MPALCRIITCSCVYFARFYLLYHLTPFPSGVSFLSRARSRSHLSVRRRTRESCLSATYRDGRHDRASLSDIPLRKVSLSLRPRKTDPIPRPRPHMLEEARVRLLRKIVTFRPSYRFLVSLLYCSRFFDSCGSCVFLLCVRFCRREETVGYIHGSEGNAPSLA